MKVFYKIINGFRVKFCRTYFCIGIGMDQLTPVYYRYTTGRSLGPVKSYQKTFSKPEQTAKEQTKSLSKTNYGKRAKQKHK